MTVSQLLRVKPDTSKDTFTGDLLNKYKDENGSIVYNMVVINQQKGKHYNVNICIEENADSILEKNCKINCSCEAFKFQDAYNLAMNDSLYEPERFILAKPQTPTRQGVKVCKHSYFALYSILNK